MMDYRTFQARLNKLIEHLEKIKHNYSRDTLQSIVEEGDAIVIRWSWRRGAWDDTLKMGHVDGVPHLDANRVHTQFLKFIADVQQEIRHSFTKEDIQHLSKTRLRDEGLEVVLIVYNCYIFWTDLQDDWIYFFHLNVKTCGHDSSTVRAIRESGDYIALIEQ